ncbi:N-acetylmuramoyl-L-alanine amidase [Salibacterium qingdaonense]|uniref:N-acetylmuramoyl-L-alanine amidase n=1 Tax=Salibacterium qingdaonense TaxID=266892 RepID=A0A1I4QBY4_9BACI|nr:N-acetylmuramoyl-L-alanine amidase [Salibacterium qingdaonense]
MRGTLGRVLQLDSGSPNIYTFLTTKKRGDFIAVIKAPTEDLKMLARLMRAEAEGEGKLGMLLAGNVMVNRVYANCLDFNNIRTIPEMVYQSPGGFEAVQRSYFYQRARNQDVRLARRLVQGQRFSPAENSLWFYRPTGACPEEWFGQPNVGRYKAHCFFSPTYADCSEVYR